MVNGVYERYDARTITTAFCGINGSYQIVETEIIYGQIITNIIILIHIGLDLTG